MQSPPKTVPDRIKAPHTVGGVQAFPRFSAGRGDYYLLTTVAGTFTLIRSEVGTDVVARPYIELPPTVGQAWVGAMHEAGTWLWPTLQAMRGGQAVYRLKPSDPDSRIAYTIQYTPTSGLATRGPYSYLPSPTRELSAAELAALAASA
jgi:hypothetical protein